MSHRIADLDPDLREMAEKLLAKAVAVGIELTVTQTYRTPDEQAALYARGRTEPGPIVTHAPPGYSWHEFRRAFDVAITHFPGDMTKADLYDGPWENVGALGEAVGLEWGGRWKHQDRPHFQHTGGFTLAYMRAKSFGKESKA
jgi:peptidoglycan L-alanyl-D-glutamate endopeptidase CwlK